MNLGVGLLEKVRVYELAKELNTTSKRLMEKLAEIDIHVKNHMSLLSDDELKALYDHIGIINQENVKKAEGEEKKVNPASQISSDTKEKKIKKDAAKAPRIIRKTEIIIDTKSEIREEMKPVVQNTHRNEHKNDNRNSRQSMVRHESANSGLRAGYVRDTGLDYLKDLNKTFVKNNNNDEGLKASIPAKADAKPEIKLPEVKPEAAREVKHETKPEAVVEAKVEEKAEIKHEVEAAAGTEAIRHENVEKPVEPEKDNKTDQHETTETVAEKNIKAEEPNSTFQNRDEEAKVQEENRSLNRPEGDKQKQDARSGYDKNQNKPAYNDNKKWQENKPYNNTRTDNKTDNRPYNRPDSRPGDNRQNDNRPGNRPDNRTDNRPNNRSFDNRPGNGPDNRTDNRSDNRGNNRPGGNNRGFGQGNRPQAAQGSNFGGRPNNRNNDRGSHLEIPKPEMSDAQKEELISQRNEVKREHINKDADKDIKRDQRKEQPNKGFGAINKNQRFRPQKVNLSEKKGITEVLSEDYILEEFYDDEGIKKTRKSVKPKKDAKAAAEKKHIPQRAVLTSVKIGESITVKSLAETLKKTATEVIKKLMAFGVMATLNHEVDFDTAAIVADEFGIKAEKEVVVNEEDILFDDAEDEDESNLQPRPPVVVVMGHVDHGKTSLLDAIRETNVIESEAGGITQHIGAYTVRINNRIITFLDTPGHEAFTAMRARGAQVTDVAILVVAADDGVMPQTIEAINHAKAANVSIIVAINKIDKPGANPDRVKQELTEYGLVAEEWGGDTICVEVSAKKRQNIDQLLEMVLLSADVLELKANPHRQAKGTIIEAKLDKDRGPIATMLVQRGTLKHGDSIVTGTIVGRIRAMTDDKGHSIKKAGPSTPVEILGLPEVPEAGEIFYAISDEKVAKHLVEKRKNKLREQQLKASAKVSLDDLFTQIKEGKVKELNIIVKADVQGSVEAVKQSLEKLSNDEVRVRIIHGGVGAIAEADVTLAQVSNAIIIGFNVRPGANVIEAAKNAGVDMRLYRVIYNAIEDVEAAMKGMLDPTFKEVVQGHAEIRQIFKVSGIGTIGGAYVTDGKIIRNSDVRIIRNGIVVFEGKLASLKRFKDDAKEVAQGFECGLSVEKFNDIKEGDVVESYIMEEVKR
jgi:translation initiation factor IF-2